MRERHNMSKSFYNYLVEDLLRDFFKKNPPYGGAKYYVLFENDEHRDGLYQALASSQFAKSIVVSDVYENKHSWIPVEDYNTVLLSPVEYASDIIVGNQSTADNGYLTTLRNAVGSVGKYKHYALLNLLSNDKLESLTTAGFNLHEIGGPFHYEAVYNSMISKLENVISDYDQFCLKRYAEKIKEQIALNEADLFVFQDILAVLQSSNPSLKGQYHKFGYFPDKKYAEPSTMTFTNEQIRKRIADNTSHFEKIKSILTSYSSDAENQLLKYYDVRLTKQILGKVEDEEWCNIDFEQVLESVNRKEEQADLKFVDFVFNKSIYTDIVVRSQGSEKKKKIYTFVCDNSGALNTNLKLAFNKVIDKALLHVMFIGDKKSTPNCKIKSNDVELEVANKPIKIEVGKDNNKFTFFFIRVNTNASTFDFIRPYFSITASANVSLKVPEDVEKITLGKGPNVVGIGSEDDCIDWKEDLLLEIPDSQFSEDDLSFTIKFADANVNFKVEVDGQKIIPLKINKIREIVFKTQESATYFEGNNKVRVGSNEYNLDSDYYEYLEIERQMIHQGCYCLERTVNFVNKKEYIPIEITLPSVVKDSLNAVYSYFKNKGFLPTLTYIDEELKGLFVDYLNSVVEVISNIQPNSTMTMEEFSLTKLGTVVEKNSRRVFFTPFHPLMVAYMLEFAEKYKGDLFDNSKVLNLISPFYLLPYISYDNDNKQPYSDEISSNLRTWLFFESVENESHVSAYNITTLMVESKLKEFKSHFKYLFQIKDSPIIISTIGIYDDTNVVKGLVEFVKNEVKNSSDGLIQRIELHEYVKNITEETFFEKLNRLNSEELIIKELAKHSTSLETGDKEITTLQVLRQFFTRISYFKHDIDECGRKIQYCHIAFYQMETGNNFSKSPTNLLRNELSFNGLISIPSTRNDNNNYVVGFGTKGMIDDSKYGMLYPVVRSMNTLYSNADKYWANSFQQNTCMAKSYVFNDQLLLQSIYENANWVTFLNPEVDIDFFYKQNLYIVHYTDQYTINAKYDSITVTKQIDQYNNMLSGMYDKSIPDPTQKDAFMKTVMNYFNSLNGDWLLSVINKTEVQVREKLSIVAGCIVMKEILSRNSDIVWIPISLEEILRVSGSIGLSQDSLFSKKTLGAKGAMSDDLLMVGVSNNNGQVSLYFYPVEVKASEGNSFVAKATEQVMNTYKVLHSTLFENGGFVNEVYRAFFASQLLTNMDKLWANQLIPESEFSYIDSCRFKLLNLDFDIKETLPVQKLGIVSAISFVGAQPPSMELTIVDKKPLCKITMPLDLCTKSICMTDDSIMKQLNSMPIIMSDEARDYVRDLERALAASNISATSISSTQPSQTPVVSSQPAPVVSEVQILEPSNNVQTEVVDDVEPEAEDVDYSQYLPVQKPIRVIVGKSKRGNEFVFEPNNTKSVTHPNMGIIGTMGCGKTQMTRSIIAQLRKESIHNVSQKPLGVLVFDYKGDYKDKEFLDTVDGTSYKFNLPFNPLKLIVTEDAEGMNLPAITADNISDSFAKAYGLGLTQQSMIKQIIIETYADFGITRDPKTWRNPAPTMDRVVDKFFETNEKGASNNAYALFDKLRDYSIFTTNNNDCVSLFEWLTTVRVIDLTSYPDDTKKVIVSLILDLFYAEMKQLGSSELKDSFREIRSMIVVDEAHQFLKKDFNSFRNIISEGRMFGVGMILSTQNVSDFKTNKQDYSQFILSWAIHHVPNITKQEIANIFGSSDTNADDYIEFIDKAPMFESICKIGHRVDAIRGLPYFELVKTDRRFANN